MSALPTPAPAEASGQGGPVSSMSPGGSPRIVHGPSKPDTTALLECLVDGLSNSIWLLADEDHRRAADLLERAAGQLQEESESERRKAKSEARARAVREGGSAGRCRVELGTGPKKFFLAQGGFLGVNITKKQTRGHD